jgi:cupin 2 domain-containing protein
MNDEQRRVAVNRAQPVGPAANSVNRPQEMNTGNLFAALPRDLCEETFEHLAGRGEVLIERIVSTGQCTPVGDWYDQDGPEWVALLAGEARLGFDDGSTLTLRPGDYADIPAHCRHRVEWTAPDTETIWLAVHY